MKSFVERHGELVGRMEIPGIDERLEISRNDVGRIGDFDEMIAAHALALDAVLVTDNTRHFSRVSGLKIENWIR